MTDTDEQARRHRSANATIAALTRAATTDGREISAPARKAFLEQFDTEHKCKWCGTVTIDQSLPPAQRARASATARTLHFTRLATISRLARSAEAKLAQQAGEAEAQLDADMAELDVP
jgi:hypothetical protein